MGSNMIAFITFYFILRVIFVRMMDISFILEIFCMYFYNCTGNPASFRIPTYMVANI